MNHKHLSKFLSLILRHKPEVVGITLDENGWADVQELLDKIKQSGKEINFEQLQEIVANNDKKRFTFDETRQKIRANQGHSIAVKLNLGAIQPPDILYHGTAKKYVPSIMEKGLLKGKRQHVHLSGDRETAIKVGRRHGKPKVLIVHAAKMAEEGHVFYQSKNMVWLTDHVPPNYIEEASPS